MSLSDADESNKSSESITAIDLENYSLTRGKLKPVSLTGNVSLNQHFIQSQSKSRRQTNRSRSFDIFGASSHDGRVGGSPSHSAASHAAAAARNAINDSVVEPLSPPSSPHKNSKSNSKPISKGPNVVSSSSVNYSHKQFNNKNKGSVGSGTGTGTGTGAAGTSGNRQTVNSFISQTYQNQNQNQQFAYRKETMSLPENLLTSKQNALAQVSLTPEENHERQNSPNSPNNTPVGSFMVQNDLFMTNPYVDPAEALEAPDEGQPSSSSPSSSDVGVVDRLDREEEDGESCNNEDMKMFKKDINKKFSGNSDSSKNMGSTGTGTGTGMGMTLCDIEDEDFELGNHESPGDDQVSAGPGPGLGGAESTNFKSFSSRDNSNFYQISSSQLHHQQQQQAKSLKNQGYGFGDGKPVVKTLDGKSWRELKMIVVGPNGILHEGWLGQGFTFDHNVPYGLVQKRGGPCGVLAVVQALVLRNLMFGSPFCDDYDLPVADPIINKTNDPTVARTFSCRRIKALICALTEIIWRCGTGARDAQLQHGSSAAWSDSSDFKLTDVETSNESGDGATVCFSGASAGAEIRVFHQVDHLKNFIHVNLQKFDCVSIVYSAVLSRGIDTVQEDFDFPNSPLLGSHGYCSQELVNLLTIGKAISNVFDNQVTLDDKVLKGIEAPCDIGLLSLFEHYDSCRVGTFLKNPAYPLWIICSESHFSVLFSTNLELTSEATIDKFDLFYYDGLGRQQNTIKLTVVLGQESDTGEYNRIHRKMRIQAGSSATSFNNNNNNNDCDVDEEMVPPIEKCIRTKWKNALVDWNDTEPIL